jgi:Ni,Fe-hydrogenase maturation factor
VEPKEVDWGIELTPELQQRVPQIVRTVLREIGVDRC